MYIVTGSFAPAANPNYQQITVTNSAKSLTVPAGATGALISIETNGVRFRDDGVAPTAGVGMPLSVGTQNWLYTGYLGGILFIAQAGTALVDVAYYQGQH